VFQIFVECAGFRRTVSVHHVFPTTLHAYFEELEIKNVFDILSGFSDSVNIEVILKANLEPFKFRLAAIRPRFRIL
jgi:hypothetical protein